MPLRGCFSDSTQREEKLDERGGNGTEGGGSRCREVEPGHSKQGEARGTW